MTTEAAAIATLTQQAGLLLDLPDTLHVTAANRINALGAEMAARLASLQKTVHVNQATGSDDNDGAAETPVKTIQKAIDLTPLGGRCVCFLQGDYVIDAPVTVLQRHVMLSSQSTRFNLSFTRRIDASTGTNFRVIDAFRLRGNAAISLHNLRINIPALDGAYTGLPDQPTTALFGCTFAPMQGCFGVCITSCDVNIPASPYCNLLASGQAFTFVTSSVTFVGARTDLNGCVVRSITAAGGTTPPRSLVTNLDQI